MPSHALRIVADPPRIGALPLLVFLPLLVVAALVPAGSLWAQETLAAGEWETGSLGPGDALDSLGIPYDVYRVPGGTPGVLSITVESEEFDPYLELGIRIDGEYTRFLENDDFPGLAHPTDARIYVEGNNDWDWELRVSAWAIASAGEYRVGVEVLGGGEPSPQSTEYGADIRGSLDESDGFAFQSFQDWYRFPGREGDRVQVVLEADFDGYLILRPFGGGRLAEDDNGFGGTNAYLEAELPSDGLYEVVVRAAQPRLGEYRLRLGTELDVEPPPDAEAPAAPAPVVQPSGAEEALPLGEWVTGILDVGDARDVDGRVFDGFYAPAGLAGVFAVTVESSVFDAQIEAGPTAQRRYTALLTADDFPGLSSPTDARLYLGMELGQTFELRVFSALGDAAGVYRIRVDPVEVGEGEPTSIYYGDDVTGVLEEGDGFVFGSFMDRYWIEGRAGELLEIAVEADFDPYVAIGLVGGGGLSQDDNSLDGRGAYLALVLPQDTRYEIQVSAANSGAGPYRLRVGRDLRPGGPPDPTGRGPVLSFDEAERAGLARDGDEYRNDLLGFVFPAPSPTLELVQGPAGQADGGDVHAWYLSEPDASRQLMVIAHRTAGGDQTGPLGAFAEGLVESLPFEVTASRPDWEASRSVEYDLVAANGVPAQMRCEADPGNRVPGLVVCLLGTTADGSSLWPILRALEVR
ncbi:MAG: PPC domain-containing protein [Gemmatimonadales bacterium]|jgi:hypothetical protein|nr:MAG: PPC domain-containing protein [Gemmatimonadales bacterium]